MTLGQQAIQQAVQQAVQQTKKQDSEEIALRLLDENLNIEVISKVTQLSTNEIRQLAKKFH